MKAQRPLAKRVWRRVFRRAEPRPSVFSAFDLPKYKKRGRFGLPIPRFMQRLRESPEAVVAIVGILAALTTTLATMWVSMDASSDALDVQEKIYKSERRDVAFNAFEESQDAFDSMVVEMRQRAKSSTTYSEIDRAFDEINRTIAAVEQRKWQLYGSIFEKEVTILSELDRNMYDIRRAFVGVFRATGSVGTPSEIGPSEISGAAARVSPVVSEDTPQSDPQTASSTVSPYADPAYESALHKMQQLVEDRNSIKMQLYIEFFALKEQLK